MFKTGSGSIFVRADPLKNETLQDVIRIFTKKLKENTKYQNIEISCQNI